jgi:calcium/calmodulin-dependent protein kinase I
LISNFDEDFIEVKLADFGLSDFIPKEGDGKTLKCGSPGYIAPEVLRGPSYTEKADLFSLGSVFYNLFTSKTLFEGRFTCQEQMITANRLCNLQHVPSSLREISPGAQDLIIKMLAIKPDERISIEDANKHLYV